jgi:hypothetical protein
MREDDLPTLFEIQLDDTAQHLAAFVNETARDREAYLRKWRKILADDAIFKRVIERDGEVVGSVGSYPIEGDTEVTYWIRKDCWGQGVATAALAMLLTEVTVRPLHGVVWPKTTSAPSGCWNGTGLFSSAPRSHSPTSGRPPSRK